MEKNGVSISLKRDDLIHPQISGNKWRKLKYHLEEFYKGSYSEILTFGGAFSNHLAATAALGNLAKIPTSALVRGEEAGDSPSLKFCSEQGMQWQGISRKDYSLKEEAGFMDSLRLLKSGLYIIPEGGKGAPALKGCAEIVDELKGNYDYLALSAGTATTAAGVLANPKAPKILVYPALKGGTFLRRAMATYLDEYRSFYALKPFSPALLAEKLELREDYHFGGYAKINDSLVQFMNRIYAQHQLKLDPVYTSKLLFGLLKDIEGGRFKAGTRILVLHSGGLQGIAGMNRRLARKSQQLIAYE